MWIFKSVGKYLQAWMQSQIRLFNFVRNCQAVLQSGSYFTLPPSVNENFYCYTSSLVIGIVFWILVILTSMYLTVVLICDFLNDKCSEHHFMSLFAICISSWMRCLLSDFAHFLRGYFLSIGFKIFCIFWIYLLSDLCCVNIFSKPVACVLYLLTVSLAEQISLILIVCIISFIFHGLHFWCYI